MSPKQPTKTSGIFTTSYATLQPLISSPSIGSARITIFSGKISCITQRMIKHTNTRHLKKAFVLAPFAYSSPAIRTP